MQQPKKQVEVITKDTIKRIFASINTRTLIGKRDFALFNLLYSTGTRIDEILSLSCRHCTWMKRKVTFLFWVKGINNVPFIC